MQYHDITSLLIPWQFKTPEGFVLRGQRSIPSGKPVLHFIHGNGFCSLMYKPMLGLLSQDFDFFLHDIQGHGDSDHGGSFVGWNRSAELAFLAWQAHQSHYADCQVFGVGHSFGGVLTAIISRQQPTCFTKILLLDPVLFPPMYLFSMQCLTAAGLYHKNPMARKALRRRQHWPDIATAQQYFYNRGLFEHWHHSALGAYLNHALTNSAPLPNAKAGHFESDNTKSEHTDSDNTEIKSAADTANLGSVGVMLKCKPAREAEIFASYPAGLWRILEQAAIKHRSFASSATCLSATLPPTAVLYGKDTYGFIARAVKRWRKFDPLVEAQQVDGGHCFMQQYPAHTALWIRHFWQHIHVAHHPAKHSSSAFPTAPDT